MFNTDEQIDLLLMAAGQAQTIIDLLQQVDNLQTIGAIDRGCWFDAEDELSAAREDIDFLEGVIENLSETLAKRGERICELEESLEASYKARAQLEDRIPAVPAAPTSNPDCTDAVKAAQRLFEQSGDCSTWVDPMSKVGLGLSPSWKSMACNSCIDFYKLDTPKKLEEQSALREEDEEESDCGPDCDVCFPPDDFCNCNYCR